MTAVGTTDKPAERPAERGREPLPRVTAVDTPDKLAKGMMTLGTPFVRLVKRGPKENSSELQKAAGVSLPAIFLFGAPVLAADVLLRGTVSSTLGWLLLLLAFLALVRRHVAVAATVLGMPFAEPECQMTLVIDVEAGRESKGLTHSLHELPRIRSRIACWIRRAILDHEHGH